MRHLPVYYPGSSIALRIRVRNRGSRTALPLGDYRARATLFTRLLGERVVASTEGEPGTVALACEDGRLLTATIPPEASAGLPCGECTVQLELVHRGDGTVLVASQKSFTLAETVKTPTDEHA